MSTESEANTESERNFNVGILIIRVNRSFYVEEEDEEEGNLKSANKDGNVRNLKMYV